jgi:S1-C subfamily serine protease
MRRRLSALALATIAWGAPAAGQQRPFANLPTQEVPGRQIGWTVNRTLDAFTRAVEENRILVMVFGDHTSDLTIRTGDLVMPCPQMNRLAGSAVFAFGSPLVDEHARRMAVALKLTDYPTVSVIAPRTDRLTELYRLEGFFDATTLAADLEKAIVAARHWPRDLPRPTGVLPGHYLAYGGLVCTPQAAERLGTARSPSPPTAPPAPASPKIVRSGSGFVASREGHMLTNHHVVEGCAQVTARVPVYDGPMAPRMTREPMRVLRTDRENDLALLQFARGGAAGLAFLDNVHPLALACDDTLGICPKPQRGQRVMTAGFPLHGTLSQLNVTDGIVSSFERADAGRELIQITAPIQPGNSGGPLVDQRGEVVGVMVSTITWRLIAERHGSLPQNINFAVPVQHAQALMSGLVPPRALSRGGRRPLDGTVAAGFLEMSTFLLECHQ